MYDIIIAGAGPSGLTAAVYSARKKLKTLLLSKDIGGQLNWTLGVENYMGYQFIEGPELMRKFEQQVRQFPIDLVLGENVDAVSLIEGGFEVKTESGGKYEGSTVVVSTGKAPRSLDVPGEKELIGRGVSYCATCDGPLFAGLDVAVVGGGNSALEATLDLIKTAKKVHLISLTPLTADHVLIEKVRESPGVTILMEHETVKISGEDLVTGITVRDLLTGRERELAAQGVFVEIGLVPNSRLVEGLAPLNLLGEIVVTCANETGIPGLYAAGDVTNVPEKQVVVAAGEGAKAALQAHRYLQRRKQSIPSHS
jgi:NADH-dependent peroxiredoxin subunit F